MPGLLETSVERVDGGGRRAIRLDQPCATAVGGRHRHPVVHKGLG